MQDSQPHENKFFSSPDEVFAYFHSIYGPDADGDPDAIALFAYSLVERDRIDWSDHHARFNGARPDTAATRAWFESKPESYFAEKQKIALNWFVSFARVLLREDVERATQQGIRDALGSIGRFWPNFWMGNLVGITGNLLFAFIIVLFVLFVTNDFSLIA